MLEILSKCGLELMDQLQELVPIHPRLGEVDKL